MSHKQLTFSQKFLFNLNVCAKKAHMGKRDFIRRAVSLYNYLIQSTKNDKKNHILKLYKKSIYVKKGEILIKKITFY